MEESSLIASSNLTYPYVHISAVKKCTYAGKQKILTCRVLDLLVVLAGLEVGEGGRAGGGVRHHLGNHRVM